jgi:CBS domain containing-hemolysin-like protein
LILPIGAVEFDAADAVLVVVVLVLLAASALLALAETSLVRMTRSKALSLLDSDRRGAAVLVRLIEDPQGFLNPVILLVLICQLVVATLVGILAAAWFGALGVVVATVFEIAAIFVLGEAVPKNWAVHHPERAALFSAPLVAALVGFWPVRWISRSLIGLANLVIGEPGDAAESEVTESELLAMADVALEEDVIETEERALIHSIIEFGDTIVREVMVPRPDMVSLDADVTVEQALDQLLVAGYSRAPVVAGGVDDVVGVAYAKDLISALRAGQGDAEVTRHVRAAHFVPETKRVSALMREMQSQTFHLAVVVDEYGGTAGLVTLEDLIEELVGEIVDEFDVEQPLVERLATGQVRVSARLGVSEANELLGLDLPTGGWDTVGGLVFDRLGHVPSEGEAIEVGGRTLTVDRVTGRRIDRVVIDPLPPVPSPTSPPTSPPTSAPARPPARPPASAPARPPARPPAGER